MSTIQQEVDAIKDKILKDDEALSWGEIFKHFNKTWKDETHHEEHRHSDFIKFINLLLTTLRDILAQEEAGSSEYTEKQYNAFYSTVINVVTNAFGRNRRCAITNEKESLIILSNAQTYNPWIIQAWLEEYPDEFPPGMTQSMSERDKQRVRQSTISPARNALEGGALAAIAGILGSTPPCLLAFWVLAVFSALNPVSLGITIGIFSLIVIASTVYSAYCHYSQSQFNKAAGKKAVEDYRKRRSSDKTHSPSFKPTIGSTATIAQVPGLGVGVDAKFDRKFSPASRPAATSTSSITPPFGSPSAASDSAGGGPGYDDTILGSISTVLHFPETTESSDAVRYAPLPLEAQVETGPTPKAI